ncbi:MAG: undecaprenyl/decaprenyl-phosphate alpha-N-acetylglucosaminyl 1-phosphate transferase [Flavobacteriales bacterium]|nr:undecaprenyl/decaprenyl-phosphate alpha-N-acetylglucosaminyl 1-phosphate transferase [Flavobacteriales bacterium]
MEKIYLLGIIFFISCLLTVIFNTVLLKFATNLGTRDTSEEIRWNPARKPSLGGITFFLVFLILVIIALFSNMIKENYYEVHLWGFLYCAVAGFVMGLADDAYNTKPLIKFLVQVSCAIVFIISDNYIRVFPVETLNYITTFLWVVGLMNSLNMLDNMDAITATVSFVILLFISIFQILNLTDDDFYLLISVGMMGSFLGFLYHNWYPSKMFMGDSGSQFIGMLLAWLGVKFLWNATDVNGQFIQSKNILIPVLVFIVTISDTATVTINRLLKGQSPFVGGRDHTTHNLVFNGFSQRQVAILYLLISLFGGLFAIYFVYGNSSWNTFSIIVSMVVSLFIFLALYSTTRLKKSQR